MPARLRGRSQAKRSRSPLLRALGDLDQAALRLLRTRGRQPPVEATMRTLGAIGEWAAVWAAIGGASAVADPARRGRWTAAAAVGPVAIGLNFAVKLAVGRERPLIEGHPPLARAPSKLSVPSAHATSSFAAATALGRVEPRARPPLYTLAAAICLSRPYLGMHYPSDVLAGAALGLAIGSLAPGLGEAGVEERLIDLAAETRAERRASQSNGGVPDRATEASADEPATPAA